MKNVITVEDSVLEWARVEAARQHEPVAHAGYCLAAEMQRREDVMNAPTRVAQRPTHLALGRRAVLSRDEIHERWK